MEIFSVLNGLKCHPTPVQLTSYPAKDPPKYKHNQCQNFLDRESKSKAKTKTLLQLALEHSRDLSLSLNHNKK